MLYKWVLFQWGYIPKLNSWCCFFFSPFRHIYHLYFQLEFSVCSFKKTAFSIVSFMTVKIISFFSSWYYLNKLELNIPNLVSAQNAENLCSFTRASVFVLSFTSNKILYFGNEKEIATGKGQVCMCIKHTLNGEKGRKLCGSNSGIH